MLYRLAKKWVNYSENSCLQEAISKEPPAEYEQIYYAEIDR